MRITAAAGRGLAALLVLLAPSCRKADSNPARDPHTLYLNSASPRGFDPAKTSDQASGWSILRTYEGLLQHTYLDRPFALEPLLCARMPEVSTDGLTYTFTLRKGIHFADDPCFVASGGRGRELTAADAAYSLRRLADQKVASVGWWILDGKVKGLDAWRATTGGDSPSDYEAPVEGLQVVDAHTLRIVLNQPYAQLLWVLAMHHGVVVPREAVETYGINFSSHPVGSGPYVLTEWTRNYRLEFTRNPKWAETGRLDAYPRQGAADDAAAGLLADAGRPLPLLDRIVVYNITDPATEWLMFMSGQLDEIRSVSRDNWNLVVDEQRRLLPALAQRGIQLFSGPSIAIGYIGFNMDDRVVGPNRKLRQALHSAFNHDEWIKLNNYRIKKPTGPIPEGVPGCPDTPLPYSFDLDRAKALLAEAGYPEGKDPATGRRLELTIDVGNPDSVEVRQSIEAFVQFMDRIGVVIKPSYNTWPSYLEKLERRQIQLYYLSWMADYPDAQNFLLLFSGQGVSPGPNHSNYVNPAFDALYNQAMAMPDSPARTALYRQMAELVREDCPWIFHSDQMQFVLRQSWARNYKFHPLAMGLEKYTRMERAGAGGAP